MYRRCRRRFRLDTARPGYARLEARLIPRAEALGLLDGGEGVNPRKPPPRAIPPGRRIQGDPEGPVAVLGLETAVSDGKWPPAVGRSRILDLGLVDGGDEFRNSVKELRLADLAPRLLILVCSLDPGSGDERLSGHPALGPVDMPVGLILTEGQKLRGCSAAMIFSYGSPIGGRWLTGRALPASGSSKWIWGHVTDASLAKLAAFAGETVHGGPRAERLTKAFALIVAESARWPEAPGAAVQRNSIDPSCASIGRKTRCGRASSRRPV